MHQERLHNQHPLAVAGIAYLPNLKAPTRAKPSPAPSANEGRVRQSRPGDGPIPSAGNTPPMYGMMPPSAEVQVHSAFKTMDASIHDPAFQPVREERQPTPTTSFEEDTAKAFAEHAQITKAFDVFKSSLGTDFEPLQQSGTQPLTTPFGPALIYRNAGVACIWLFYHVGRILLVAISSRNASSRHGVSRSNSSLE